MATAIGATENLDFLCEKGNMVRRRWHFFPLKYGFSTFLGQGCDHYPLLCDGVEH